MRTSQIIYEFELGSCNKSGRLLNLVEAHSLYCKKSIGLHMPTILKPMYDLPNVFSI